MTIPAIIRVTFKTVWYNPRLDVLASPVMMLGGYFYEYGNTGSYRPIVNKNEWVYIDFI